MGDIQELMNKVDKLEKAVEQLENKTGSTDKTLKMLIDNINGYQAKIVETNILWRNYLKQRMGLSDRDIPAPMNKKDQVLLLYSKGLSKNQIANILGVSRGTVYNYLGS